MATAPTLAASRPGVSGSTPRPESSCKLEWLTLDRHNVGSAIADHPRLLAWSAIADPTRAPSSRVCLRNAGDDEASQ
jgi:hypothetical protein